MKKILAFVLCLVMVLSLTVMASAATIDPTGKTEAEIVDAAYALEENEAFTAKCTLKGVVTSIDTAYSEQYKNVTVTIVVADKKDKPIQCYRLKGEGADQVALGDTITVEGTIKNYKGTIEFDSGCELKAREAGNVQLYDPTGKTELEILDAAYALEAGSAFGAKCTLKGVVTKINTAYSEQYKNISVTIVVAEKEDKPIQCFRLKGEGADKIAVGDTITVEGLIKKHENTVEFDAGCELKEREAGNVELYDPTGKTEAEILDAAYALEEGLSFGAECTLKGVVTKVDTAYSEQYKNVTVTIQIGDNAEKLIQCFRLKGEGVDKLDVGYTVSVTGTIKNYEGSIQFDAGCTAADIVAPIPPEDTNPATGDAISVVLALLAVSGLGIVVLKKKA